MQDTAVVTWADIIGPEKQKPYLQNILQEVKAMRDAGKIIYPAQNNIFNALKLTPLEQVKVVILGQDPYHNPNQAHGLAFSVLEPTKPPPSLRNIYKEIAADCHTNMNIQNGNLTYLAKQGVLLLNTTLTVEQNQPRSHHKLGWQQFTDAVIKAINDHAEPTVFLLWGADAKSKIPLISNQHHLILTAPHPSPLSAHRGFMGCKHFSRANNWLQKQRQSTINWSNS